MVRHWGGTQGILREEEEGGGRGALKMRKGRWWPTCSGKETSLNR